MRAKFILSKITRVVLIYGLNYGRVAAKAQFSVNQSITMVQGGIMFKSIIKAGLRLVFYRRLMLLNKKQKFYRQYEGDLEFIREYQLLAFNKVWGKAKIEIPFYKWWSDEHNLPDRLFSLDDLALFPVLTKEILQKNESLIFGTKHNYETVSTGGSTGQPTSFITSNKQKDIEYANTYLGRSDFGIKPMDKVILFWGHSHLFGSGVWGQVNQFKRILADKLISTTRLNAYDLSLDTVARYVKRLSNETAVCMIGYTSLLYSLARYIVDNRVNFTCLSDLQAVIVTAETVTTRDIDVIGKAFNVPVVIEYGMAETSVVAYSTSEGRGLRIFWDSFIAQSDKQNQLNLTTIYDREFPLINYETKDIVEPLVQIGTSLVTIENIKGRSRDNVKLRTEDGGFLELSGILIVHIIKGNAGVYSISYKQCRDNELEVYVVLDSKVDIKDIESSFLKELKKENDGFDVTAVRLIRKDDAFRTLAGKTAMRVQ